MVTGTITLFICIIKCVKKDNCQACLLNHVLVPACSHIF